MIHYHGTPIGGSRDNTDEFLVGRHALVPYPRQDDMESVAAFCQSFVQDCGAFSKWKKGGKMEDKDCYGYFEFVEKWHKHPGFDWAIIPDVIEGTAAENDRFLDMWPSNFKGVPVYHNYFPIDRLKKLADKYEVVALGSSGEFSQVGSLKWWGRMAEMMNAICDDKGRPACKLHGLRMLDYRIFENIPLSSADSTNVARNNCRGGEDPLATTAERSKNIAKRVEKHNSAPVWVPRPKQVYLFEDIFKLSA